MTWSVTGCGQQMNARSNFRFFLDQLNVIANRRQAAAGRCQDDSSFEFLRHPHGAEIRVF
jgi:hypothetical protein